jgi:hypothetical protein
MSYHVVQPYGVRVGEWTLLSEHESAQEAFAAIDRLSERMLRTGAPSDAIEVMVVDEQGVTVARPGVH